MHTHIYKEIVERNIPHDHHESDLYVPVTDETMDLVRQYAFLTNVTTFVSSIDKTLWYDIPFAYLPFWERAARRA